jgi:hypothetical protein
LPLGQRRQQIFAAPPGMISAAENMCSPSAQSDGRLELFAEHIENETSRNIRGVSAE